MPCLGGVRNVTEAEGRRGMGKGMGTGTGMVL